MYRKLLLTHDGSELASAAVPHACAIACAMDAEVMLLRVTESIGQTLARMGTVSFAPAGAAVAEVAVEEVERHDREAQQELEAVKAGLEAAGVRRVTAVVVEGPAGPTVADTASQSECDLIVMSTHGRSGLGRALLGSVAEYVARHSDIPVLLVHASAPQAE